MASAPDNILEPYTRRVDTRARVFKRAALLLFVGLYSAFMGLMLVVLPVNLVAIPATPLLILTAIVIWMLPDLDVRIDRQMIVLFLVFFFTMTVWPIYLALSLPGLPWITLGRVSLFALLAIAIFAFAQSKRLRDESVDILFARPFLGWVFVAWVVVQAISLPLAPSPFGTMNRWLMNQIYWNFMFVIAAWVFAHSGAPKRFMQLLLWIAMIVCGLMIWEYHRGELPWADYIPPWLIADPEFVARVLAPQARAGDGLYRARSVFTVSLTASEFLCMALPFVIHAMIRSKSFRKRVALVGLYVLVLTGMWLTNARSAWVGFALAHATYFAYFTWRRWKNYRDGGDMLGPTLMMAVPAAVAVFAVATLTWPRLRVRVLGGEQHQGSNNARETQYEMMWPHLKRNPFGHGAGNGGEILGFANGDGVYTVDAYPINLLLDYGVLGLMAFFTLFGFAVFLSFRTALRTPDHEEEGQLAAPCGAALFNFIIVKLVLSIESSHYIAYCLLGLAAALTWRDIRGRTLEVKRKSPPAQRLETAFVR